MRAAALGIITSEKVQYKSFGDNYGGDPINQNAKVKHLCGFRTIV